MKIEPKILPGYMELLPEGQILFNEMYDKIRGVYERFGYLPLDTPILEYSEVLLAKAGGETEKQIYRFNKGETDISLRFDLTVPLARYVAGRYNDLVFPFKRYQMGKVFRGERQQKGRFREFYQCDIDIIGDTVLDLRNDAEIPAVIYSVFTELGFNNFTIKINNRKLLSGLFSSLNVSNLSADILRIIDKIAKIGEEKVIKELKNIDLKESTIKSIISFLSIKGSKEEILKELDNLDINDALFLKGREELKTVLEGINNFNVPKENYEIDLTIARGLDYYTGTIYETILNDYPSLGSVCSGGRYDNLAEYYTDKVLPGVGISIGLSRLFFQLREENIIAPKTKNTAEVLIIPFDNDFSYALSIMSALIQAKIPTQIYYEQVPLKKKLQYANRLGIPYIALIGEDEKEKNVITLKNMESGIQEELNITEVIKKF